MTAADHIVEQRAHATALERRSDEARGAVAVLHASIAAERERLDRAGRPPIDLGDLGRTSPLSPSWGLERGQPIDRVYIEEFLERHATDIRGHVMEVKDAGYTHRFGGERVTEVLILDVDPANGASTIVGDLADPTTLGADRFDCVVLTQVLNVIFDAPAALANAIRALKPGGVLLCTVSALNRVSCEAGGDDGDYWRFTEAALRRLCVNLLPPGAFSVESRGNVLSCAAFLYGLAGHEVEPARLHATDPAFPLVVMLRAVKPQVQPPLRARKQDEARGLAVFYHRVATFAVDPHDLCVTPEVFEAHLAWLASRFEILSLEDLASRALADR